MRPKVACRDVCLLHKADIKFEAERGKAGVSDHPMCSFAVASLTVAIFFTRPCCGLHPGQRRSLCTWCAPSRRCRIGLLSPTVPTGTAISSPSHHNGIMPKNCCRRESKRPREKGAPMTPRAHDRHFAAQKCSQDLTINHDYREFLRH